MEIFVKLKKCFNQLGIRSKENANFNWKNSIITFLFACCSFAMIIFMFFEATDFMEFGNAYYGAASSGLNVIMLAFNVMKKKNIFQLIGRFEKMIKTSK